MDPLTLILALMKRDTDALGFIPSPTIRDRFIKRDAYVLARDAHNRPIGYLLHGPLKRNAPAFVHQVCLELDHRRRRHATDAVQTLIARATAAGSTEIRLRCATDLPANLFWISMGFLPVALSPGGTRRKRRIATYVLPLPPRTPLDVAPLGLLHYRNLAGGTRSPGSRPASAREQPG